MLYALHNDSILITVDLGPILVASTKRMHARRFSGYTLLARVLSRPSILFYWFSSAKCWGFFCFFLGGGGW